MTKRLEITAAVAQAGLCGIAFPKKSNWALCISHYVSIRHRRHGLDSEVYDGPAGAGSHMGAMS